MTAKEKAAAKNVEPSLVGGVANPHTPVASVKVYQKSRSNGIVRWSWKFMLDDEIQFDGHEDKETEEEARKHAMKMCGTSWNVIIQRA